MAYEVDNPCSGEEIVPMKRCLILALLLAVTPAFAQDANKLEAQLTNDRAKQNPALQEKIPKAQGRVVPVGTVYMMSKNGLQVINPVAPRKYGSGAQNITANINAENPRDLTQDDPKPFGGLILFGWAF